ncbi:MAG: DMT family transporter [Minwuiales bacterium]|nr:DMT family transporter [Minwuiales bacterium]
MTVSAVRSADGWAQLRILVAAVLAVTLWGATPVVTRFAVGVADPLTVGLLRTVLAAVAAGPLLALMRIPLPRGPRRLGSLALSSITALAVFPVLLSLGLERTSAANAALIMTAIPIFTGIFAAVAERLPLPPLFWLGAAVAMVGEAALVGLRLGAPAGGDLYGDLLIAAAGVTAALGYVAGARLSRDYPAVGATLWGLVLAGCLVLPLLAALFAFGPVPRLSGDLWLALVYLAVGGSLIAYIAWYWALSRGGIARTGTVQYAQPLVTVVLAALFLRESITWPLLAAGAIIVAGIAIAQRR